jgi:hypothetical protein
MVADLGSPPYSTTELDLCFAVFRMSIYRSVTSSGECDCCVVCTVELRFGTQVVGPGSGDSIKIS